MLRTLCDGHGGNGPSDADADLKPEAWDECLKKDDEMFWYFVIRFLAATGARVSELIQIKDEHVNWGILTYTPKVENSVESIFLKNCKKKPFLG